MKRKIRLTESDLHNIIKESVETILSELDWKTYANAEGEALKRSMGERPLSAAKERRMSDPKKQYKAWNDITYANRRFRDAKVKSFNDTHNAAKMVKRSDDGPKIIDDYDYLKTDVGPFFGNGYTFKNKDERYKPDFFYTDAHKKATEDTINDTQEYSDYLMGNYEYQKGKGWVKK